MELGPAPTVVFEDAATGAPRPDTPAHLEAPPRRSRLVPPPGRARTALIVAGALLVVAVPLLVALRALHHPRWYPILDVAQTELRVRDVASTHPPLVGLPGRIGTFAQQGSHPGPLSFWALWPLYRLFGASSWALAVATVGLHLLAAGIALWIAHRRGRAPLVVGVAVVLVLLMSAYGASLLTQPWNPYLPVLWWFVFLLAVWSVLCDDLPLLPVAVFAGSFCAQTHVSYLGLVPGLGVLAFTVVAVRTYSRRRERAARRRYAGWSLVALALGVVLWTPPVIDQIVHSPGNLSVLWDHFTSPAEAVAGPRQGLEQLLANLNPWRLVTRPVVVTWQTGSAPGSVVPGLLLVLACAATAVVAWRLRHRVLLRLHAVLLVSVPLGVVSASRINGFIWYYLLLWAWGLAASMLLAVAWTVAVVVDRRVDLHVRRRTEQAGHVVLAAGLVTLAALFAFDAASIDPPAARLSTTLGKVVPPTAAVLARRRDHGPYLVTWLPDPWSMGAGGYGLLDDLERRGFHVSVEPSQRAGATAHRVNAGDTKLEVHLAIGPEIERWQRRRGFRQITFFDPRTREDRSEYARLHTEVIGVLESDRRAQLVPVVDQNLFALTFDPRVPAAAKRRIVRMEELGLPAAVFVGPSASAQ